MEPLLRHMVDMTRHRDHTMLDLSTLSAVQELAHAAQTRVLSVIQVRNQTCVRPRAVGTRGAQPRMEEGLDNSQAAEPVTHYPELAACLEARHESAERIDAGRTRTIWLPIWIKDKADTCLEITNPTPYTNQTLQIIAGVVSVYRNFQNLLDYSERDSLTGLLNRKTFDDQLAKMLTASIGVEAVALPDSTERRRDSEEQKQWLAVIDVDHFKKVNDQFGHLYGDEVLILIANLMQSSFCSQDRIFRFGGEEFVVLLHAATLANVRKSIEGFRASVEQHAFPQVGRITVSVGFVGLSAYESPVVTLGHADQALYHAKSNGRNQVCLYDDLVGQGAVRAQAANDTAEFF